MTAETSCLDKSKLLLLDFLSVQAASLSLEDRTVRAAQDPSSLEKRHTRPSANSLESLQAVVPLGVAERVPAHGFRESDGHIATQCHLQNPKLPNHAQSITERCESLEPPSARTSRFRNLGPSWPLGSRQRCHLESATAYGSEGCVPRCRWLCEQLNDREKGLHQRGGDDARA